MSRQGLALHVHLATIVVDEDSLFDLVWLMAEQGGGGGKWQLLTTHDRGSFLKKSRGGGGTPPLCRPLRTGQLLMRTHY